MLSQNGLYAIIAGTLNFDKAKSNLTTLRDLHIIPQISFLSRGDNFDRIVWLGFDRGTQLDFMTQPVYRGVVQRLQAAMTKLSLYSGPVDGLIGRTTVNAFNAYTAKYGIPNTDIISMDALADIERTSSDGFRNDPERSLAQAQGFNDALSYNEGKREFLRTFCSLSAVMHEVSTKIGGHLVMEDDDQKLRVRLVGRNGRRRYEPASKDRLVAACLEPGVSVSRLALEHGVNANLLRKWIKKRTETRSLAAVLITGVHPGSA